MQSAAQRAPQPLPLSLRKSPLPEPATGKNDLGHLSRDPHSILGNIGNTPLLRIRNIGQPLSSPKSSPKPLVEIYAKAEWFNPGGSIKDRPALSMLLEAERTGALTAEKAIIDATSGNTGIAYAMIGSVLGYKILLAIPSNASAERKQILRAYGAELLFTDPLEGTDGAQMRVKEIVARDPDKYFYPDQYNNPANWKAHYATTAPEIWRQTGGRITHFVVGLGTTGTFVGTLRRLKEFNPGIIGVSFEPDSPMHGLEGLKHLPTAIKPGIYDPTLADQHLSISTDEAYVMVNRLAREEGMFVGISSGAAMAACQRVASQLPAGVIVTIFPDGGARYGGDRFWQE